jgi:hypothetical protein
VDVSAKLGVEPQQLVQARREIEGEGRQ